MELNPSSKPSLSLSLITRLKLFYVHLVLDNIRRPDFTLNRRLHNLCNIKLPAKSSPRHGVSSHDFTVDPSRNLWFRLYLPAPLPDTASSLPVLVFFHGGGFVFLSASSFPYDAVCRRLARHLQAVVVSVNYRLAPEHKFPAQYDDAFDVLRFLDDPHRRQSIPSWPENADVSKCFLVGDSAGGNMAHHTAVRSCEETLSEVRVVGSVVIQPFFGGAERRESEIRLKRMPMITVERVEWLWRAFLPDGLGPDHWARNVSGPNAKDLSGLDLPPTLVVVGGFDPLQDWQRSYSSWLKNNGKEVKLLEYPNVFHAFYAFPSLPESSKLIDEIRDFVGIQISRS